MIDEQIVSANGIDLHCLVAGPPDGELVLLLHGFPELAISWQHQLPALAEAGYRAVAPNQRGYGATTRQGPYDTVTLAQDVSELITALGHERAYVVGHDWGGGVAWTFAGLHPQQLLGLVAANCPPPSVLARAMRSSPRQLRKSWYMFFFQIPYLPEYLLTRDDAAAMVGSMVRGSYVRNAFSKDDLEQYRAAFAEPGAATAAINWYRAALGRPRRRVGLVRTPIAAPVLVLWGARDAFLGSELVAPDRLATVLAPGNAATVVFFDGAGHFVQNEVPMEFNEALIDWLRIRRG
ncbi:MAG: alpha/beta hydrolase [Actinomycetes bacterium]